MPAEFLSLPLLASLIITAHHHSVIASLNLKRNYFLVNSTPVHPIFVNLTSVYLLFVDQRIVFLSFLKTKKDILLKFSLQSCTFKFFRYLEKLTKRPTTIHSKLVKYASRLLGFDGSNFALFSRSKNNLNIFYFQFQLKIWVNDSNVRFQEQSSVQVV